ncbi:transcription initiation factor TFIID subunit 6-like [Corticium candelabrum]|uniref:transcription initiation factor TFIID subunit 6-like n=1 Tax=Corticium candelabrum TaxID=121492 RepID=UPI002E25D1B7|nr:transcription initiation factor TFIID subunit 6-like [Corticium candelabrum]
MAAVDAVDFDSVEPRVGVESVRSTAESVGIVSLDDNLAHTLADDTTFKVKYIIQESSKFSLHAKRQKMTADDFDRALKQCNLEPLYGFRAGEFIPFRCASGGGREVHFLDDHEVELSDIISTPLPKLPIDVTVKAHWLAVDGIQPAIPENPPPDWK